MNRLALPVALVALLGATTPLVHAQSATGSEERDILTEGRRLTTLFYAGRTADLWPMLSPEFKANLQSADRLTAFREQVRQQLGSEVTVLDEQATLSGTSHVYVRTAKFERGPSRIEVSWVWDDAHVITGFMVRPAQAAEAAPTRYLDYDTRTRLRLPFDGEWMVFWGGRDIGDNQHAVARDQRFAYDFLQARDGQTHRDAGRSNGDYYCWDIQIVAPADGVVVEAIDGVDDNVPGTMNAAQRFGNHVVLDHGNGEYSVFAHFKKGSVAVKKGDAVTAGRLLGHCGNSGYSSEPHLHYHLQNAASLGNADGLPAFFDRISVNRQPAGRAEPKRGNTVSNAFR